MILLRFVAVFLVGILLYPLSFLVCGKLFGEILFYRGILHALLVFLIQSGIGMAVLGGANVRKFIPQGALRRFCAVALASLALSFNLTFLIVFPVTFDRSVTMYLIEELAHKKGLTEVQMESLLINDYVVKKKAVARRMQEQQLSQNVKREGKTFVLTPQGEFFIRFSRLIRTLFAIPVHQPGEFGSASPEPLEQTPD